MNTLLKTSNGSNAVLSEDTLDALEELGGILKTIYIRMKKEGYDIVDGEVVKINENVNE